MIEAGDKYSSFLKRAMKINRHHWVNIEHYSLHLSAKYIKRRISYKGSISCLFLRPVSAIPNPKLYDMLVCMWQDDCINNTRFGKFKEFELVCFLFRTGWPTCFNHPGG